MPELFDDSEVVHDLLHSHLVQGGHLQVRLVCIGLSYNLAADDQEEGQASHPADLGKPSEGHDGKVLCFVQVSSFAENVDVIKEPVEEVEAA